MAVRVKRYTPAGIEQRENQDEAWENRITVVDGQQFHWGPNEVRNFMDDGVGLAHAAFSSADSIVQDTIPFSSSRS